MQSFTPLSPEGEAIVEVKRSVGGKADDSHKQLTARATVIDEHLDSCIGLLENSTTSVSCWGVKSSSASTAQAVAVLERERQNLRRILNEIVELTRTNTSETEILRNRLAEAEKALLSSRIPQPVELVEDLQKKVQALQMERSEFQVTVSKLSRTRELTSARLRDLTSEYQGIAEKAELELRRLESELIRMEEARDIAVAESLDKTRELRNFQKRYDTLKTIAESHREAAAAAKKQTDEMAAGHAKAMEMQTRRVAEARAAREAATAELDALRREHASLHDAFLRAGGVEHQLSLVRKASFAARTSALSSGGGSGGRTVTRNLLRVRNGWCVHAKPCGTAADASKLTPVPYEGQAGLEALIRSQGLYLCCTCLANGSFKIL